VARTKLRGLTVAGLRIAIEAPPSLPWNWPAGPLGRFASPAEEADLHVGVRVGRVEAPPAGSVRYDSGGGIFDVASDGREVVFALRIRGVLQRVARFDPDFRQGEVVLAPDSLYARECFYPLAYPLDELIFLHRIVRDEGLLIHACGAERDGNVLIFTGPSGAGKTTIARLLEGQAGARILSDDRIVLRREGEQLWAHGTPWHGDAPLSLAAGARVAALHVIRHAPEVLAEPLAGAAAATAVLGNAFLPAHDPAGAAAALDFAARLVARVPVIRLGFPKDERLVRYAFGSAPGRPRSPGRRPLAPPPAPRIAS
jgi:hypothetical protein